MRQMTHQPDRRSFIKLAGVAAAMAAGARMAAKPLGLPIGIQPYTVRNELAQDLAGTIEKLAAMGYEAIEVRDPFYGHTREELQSVLKKFGMPSPSAYYDHLADDDAWRKSIESATAFGAKYMVTPVPGDWTKSLDGWKRAATRLNELGGLCRKAGITLLYHNHNFEFKVFEGKIAYDELLRLTDPELLKMEMDCFWTTFAGKDPVEYFTRYPGRFAILHIKDLKKGIEPSTDSPKGNPFTEVGTGVIDYRRIFKAAPTGGLKHYFMEQDRWDRPALESARLSCEYLKKLDV